MTHALIIDHDMSVSWAINDSLMSLGLDSFDHPWTEANAIKAAGCHGPDQRPPRGFAQW